MKFKSERYNGSLPNLVYNPYAWTKVSNIIFLDSPVGTGFSFSQHPTGYETGDKSWSIHAAIFLRKWFVDHQEFLSNPLYIAGDSYAGKVVPLVLHHLLNDGCESGERPTFNIQGYMIGNPTTGENIDSNARVPFALGMGIISYELFQSIHKNCKGEIDYKNPKNVACASQIQIFEGFTSEIMFSHVLEPKCSLAAPVHKLSIRATSLLQETVTVPDVNCRTYAYYLMDLWSNSDVVREALHVKKGTVREWVRCNNDLIYETDIRSSIPYHVHLTTRGYSALVYSGDHDLMVPFVGTEEWIRSLQFFTVDKWRSWHVAGQVAGYTVSYSNNLTFATVKGAGHTAPEYKPKECLAMFQRWISQHSL